MTAVPGSGTSGSGVDAAPNPLRRLSDDEVADWWAMYDTGRSVGQVADHFVRPAWAVHAKLTELGVLRDHIKHGATAAGDGCTHHYRSRLGPETPEDIRARRALADRLLQTEAGRNIAACLARIAPDTDGDHERPHHNDGTIGAALPYAHRRRHYVPMSARQREMDRLAKPRGVYLQVCNDLRAAGMLPGGGAGRGRWS